MRAPIVSLIAGMTLLRLVLGGTVGLTVDESYAVVLGRHSQLSYFDHPPMTSWLAGAAAWLAGSEHPLVVRMPFVCLAAATTLLCFRLSAALFGAGAGLAAAVLLNLTLFYGACGGWVLPDVPLACFALLAAWCLARAVLGPKARATGAWIGFGAAVGLALLSKYHAVFLAAGAGLFLVTSAPCRFWLRRREPWLAAGVALVLFSPVLLWNASHHWASFRFQSGRALSGGGGSPLLDVVGGQALWLTPWLWLPLLAVLVAAAWRGPADASRWLLVCLAAGPIVGFTAIAALGSRGLPHWSLPGYLFVLPLLGVSVAARLARRETLTRGWLAASAAAVTFLVAALVVHVRTGWLTHRAPWLFADGDPTQDLLPWEDLRPALQEWRASAPGATFAGVRWIDAAQLAHLLGPAVPVTSIGGDARGFAHLDPSVTLEGRDVILVARRQNLVTEPMVTHARFFRRLRPLGLAAVTRGGQTEFLVSAYLGEGYRAP